MWGTRQICWSARQCMPNKTCGGMVNQLELRKCQVRCWTPRIDLQEMFLQQSALVRARPSLTSLRSQPSVHGWFVVCGLFLQVPLQSSVFTKRKCAPRRFIQRCAIPVLHYTLTNTGTCRFNCLLACGCGIFVVVVVVEKSTRWTFSNFV